MPTFGYADRILRVDLSSERTSCTPIQDYVKYLGGRGIATRIYWEEVSPETSAFDPGNTLIFAVGPLAGIPVLGTSRWVACGRSALTTPEHFSSANLGGRWGAEMKFAGYDALVIQGKADRPVYLFIDGGTVEFRDASHLWGKGAIETRAILKRDLGDSVKVAAIGPAGENLVTIATLLADNDASGSGGLGATMGSKNLKAVVVRRSEKTLNVAHPDRLKEVTDYYRQLKRIPFPMSASRCTINDEPSLNVRRVPGPKMKKDPCYGCPGMCPRRLYQAQDGRTGKFVCDSAMFYQPVAESYYGSWNDVPFYANRLCDDQGLDTNAINLIIGWLQQCHREGILNDANTGLPLSKIGSLEFADTLINSISHREGFGDKLAQGIDRAAESLGPEASQQVVRAGILSKPGYNVLYGPRLFISTALLYAMEPRTPISQLHHLSNLINKWVSWVNGVPGVTLDTDSVRAIARRFFGSELAADFSTYEGKALAAKMIQDREYVKESLVLCDWLFPVMDLADTENQVGDPTLESRIFSAVTGNQVDEYELYRYGERVFNLQRAILVREGQRGRAFDLVPEHCFSDPLEWYYFSHECLVPGRDGEVMSRKGAIFERDRFERMKDEYYELRNWDVATGLPKKSNLEALGMEDVAEDLDRRGLAR